MLEIKRTSITRLKQWYLCFRWHDVCCLEIKRTSITRLKLWCIMSVGSVSLRLKSKEPRLRDWNYVDLFLLIPRNMQLEIKRTSITRLKREFRRECAGRALYSLKSKEPRLRDWNEDNRVSAFVSLDLKSKEPRLRDWNVREYWRVLWGLMAWNQKNLDYEIETTDRLISSGPVFTTWNQKNLDYEIETPVRLTEKVQLSPLEIKRTSITRLKLCALVSM